MLPTHKVLSTVPTTCSHGHAGTPRAPMDSGSSLLLPKTRRLSQSGTTGWHFEVRPAVLRREMMGSCCCEGDAGSRTACVTSYFGPCLWNVQNWARSDSGPQSRVPCPTGRVGNPVSIACPASSLHTLTTGCLVRVALCPSPKDGKGAPPRGPWGLALPGPETLELAFPPALWDDDAFVIGLSEIKWGSAGT